RSSTLSLRTRSPRAPHPFPTRRSSDLWEEYDPFLLMAEDFFQRGTFGMHPHRGIETVTYVIDGKLEHLDNKSGKGELLSRCSSLDRKSTRLNSSHVKISYAVFCLKKKN